MNESFCQCGPTGKCARQDVCACKKAQRKCNIQCFCLKAKCKNFELSSASSAAIGAIGDADVTETLNEVCKNSQVALPHFSHDFNESD